MDRWMDGRGRTILCAVAVAVVTAATVLILAVASGVSAQTLTEPNAQKKMSPSSAAAKSPASARAKRCSSYGDGFVYVPASDSCIKLGGYVRVDGVANGH